jgi:hypothetical protein
MPDYTKDLRKTDDTSMHKGNSMKGIAILLLVCSAFLIGCSKPKCLRWETRTVYHQRCVERDATRNFCTRYERVPIEERVCVEKEKPGKD